MQPVAVASARTERSYRARARRSIERRRLAIRELPQPVEIELDAPELREFLVKGLSQILIGQGGAREKRRAEHIARLVLRRMAVGGGALAKTRLDRVIVDFDSQHVAASGHHKLSPRPGPGNTRRGADL